MKILEKYVEICGKFSDMASLLLALSRSAKAVQITGDIELFCNEIGDALELLGKVQHDISEEAWDMVDVLENILQQYEKKS